MNALDKALLDRRLLLYTYDGDTLVDGVPQERYIYSVTRWGRLEFPTGREITLASGEKHRIDALATFADEVVVPSDGLIVDELTDEEYRVLAVLPRRGQRAVHVHLRRADDDAHTLALS